MPRNAGFGADVYISIESKNGNAQRFDDWLGGVTGWQERFETFYARRPHLVIAQIEGVTEPFDSAHPPAIHPLYLTIKEHMDILAFVNKVEPADLGAELKVHQ